MKHTIGSMAFAAGCLLLGVAALYLGSTRLLLSAQLVAAGVTVDGAVVERARIQRRDASTRVRLKIHYADESGEQHTIETVRPMANFFPLDDAAPLSVRYLRSKPERALVDQLWDRWLGPVLALIVGAGAIWIGWAAVRNGSTRDASSVPRK